MVPCPSSGRPQFSLDPWTVNYPHDKQLLLFLFLFFCYYCTQLSQYSFAISVCCQPLGVRFRRDRSEEGRQLHAYSTYTPFARWYCGQVYHVWSGLPEFKSRLHLTMCVCVCDLSVFHYLAFLGLSFLICMMEMTTASMELLWGLSKKWHAKCPVLRSAHKKPLKLV